MREGDDATAWIKEGIEGKKSPTLQSAAAILSDQTGLATALQYAHQYASHFGTYEVTPDAPIRMLPPAQMDDRWIYTMNPIFGSKHRVYFYNKGISGLIGSGIQEIFYRVNIAKESFNPIMYYTILSQQKDNVYDPYVRAMLLGYQPFLTRNKVGLMAPWNASVQEAFSFLSDIRKSLGWDPVSFWNKGDVIDEY